MAGRVARGDVRLIRLSALDKVRPVVVMTNDLVIGALATVTVAQITSTIRGVSSEVVLTEQDGMKNVCVVNLHNLQTVRQSQLGKRVARLSPMKMQQVCAAMQYALGCPSDF